MNRIYNLTKSTFIHNLEPSKNYGNSNQLYAFKNKDNTTRTLLHFDVDTEMMESVEEVDSTYKVRLYISDSRILNDEFKLFAHPLTKEWVEGVGSVYNTQNGASWTQNGVESNWDTEGGDFDETVSLPVHINYKDMMVEIDVDDYLSYVDNTGNNFGVILKTDESETINAYNLAFYSNESPEGFNPMVIRFEDSYVESPSADMELYTGSEPIDIMSYNYKHTLAEGELFSILFNIRSFYKRTDLFFSNSKLYYLPEMQYRIVDETRDKLIFDFNEYTKIPVTEGGLLLSLFTLNYKRGLYSLQVKYDGFDKTYFSNKIEFKVK